MVVTLVLGVLGEGKRTHFYFAHGIMGLILIILNFVAFGFCLKRHSHPRINLAHKINLTILITLAVFVIMTDFVDLSTISCLFQFPPQVIFVIAGFSFAIPTVSATTMVLMKMGLEKWFVGKQVTVYYERKLRDEKRGWPFMETTQSLDEKSYEGISRPFKA